MIAHCINLDSAVQRRQLIEQQAAAAGLPFALERLPAIDGRNHPEIETSLRPGQLGCLLSHLEVLRRSLAHDDDLLVMEDDERFDGELRHGMALAEGLPRADWDLLYLDATIVETEDYLLLARAMWRWLLDGGLPAAVPVPPSAHLYGTHAYIVNRDSRHKLIALLQDNLGAGLPIDNLYCAATKAGRLRTRIAVPFLCGPGSETSNSQITAGEHPLAAHWARFRETLYLGSARAAAEPHFHALNRSAQAAIDARLKFGLLPTFDPDQQHRLRAAGTA